MSDQPRVKAGQVYESTDPRDWSPKANRCRRVRILKQDGSNALAENIETGRRSYIAVHHLRPTSGKRGWNIVEQNDD